MSKLSVCLLFPDLLGTYGDGGNAIVLGKRLEWRGIAHELIPVTTGKPVPQTCDIYLLGGGEDQPQSTVTDQLARGQSLAKAVDGGASVLAVCAGMQVLGESFAVSNGTKTGLGILDAVTFRDSAPRRVGELVVMPDVSVANKTLTGYENHGGATRLGADAKPLGRVVRGRGNDDGTGVEGAIQGKVIGTYMHGPVLARNPQLADTLIEWATGKAVAPLDDQEIEELRNERLNARDDGASVFKKVLLALKR